MPRKKKEHQLKMHDRSNGFDRNKLEGYLSEIDVADDELDSLRGEYMQKCKGPRSQIKEIMATVKEDGVNVKAFRAVLSDHRFERKQQKVVAALESDDAQDYDAMLEALGAFSDTPLGEAALSRAKPANEGDEVLDNLGRGPIS
jgi:uncharacterized protein (UPF0335 family)